MATAEPNHPQYFQYIAQFVTWIFVIGGWYFVDRRHNARETRKETKSEIDTLVETIEGVIDAATAYHTAPEHDQIRSETVKIQLSKVSRSLNLLQQRKVCIDIGFMVRLRQACTLNNFDTQGFTQQLHATPLVKEVTETGQELIYILRSTFISKYPC